VSHRVTSPAGQRFLVSHRVTSSAVQRFLVSHPVTSPAGQRFLVSHRVTSSAGQRFLVSHRVTSSAGQRFLVSHRVTSSAGRRFLVSHPVTSSAVQRLLATLRVQRGTVERRKMSTSAKSQGRPVVALNLPEYKVPVLISKATFIVQQMTDNARFQTPSPSLADVQAAIDDLVQATTTALTRMQGSVAERNAKREVLVTRLRHLASYVQAIADADPVHAVSIIESAGMDAKKVGRPPPRVYRAVRGRVSGEVSIVVPSAGDRAGYEHQYSLDGGKTWLPFPQPFTNETEVTLSDLRPGATVWLRYRSTVKGATGDWSQTISFIVD
jgi:hypothetical protein